MYNTFCKIQQLNADVYRTIEEHLKVQKLKLKLKREIENIQNG